MRALALLTAAVVLAASGLVSPAAADPIPAYFTGNHTSAICASVQVPDFEPLSVLIQLNFDPDMNGGISLDAADDLFLGLRDTVLALLGDDVEVFCSFSPSEAQEAFGLEAFAFTELVSPQFQDFGFALYVILNVYNWIEPEFLGFAATLRADVFLVEGASDLSYLASLSSPVLAAGAF